MKISHEDMMSFELNYYDIISALQNHVQNKITKQHSAIHLELHQNSDDPTKDVIIIKFAKKLDDI